MVGQEQTIKYYSAVFSIRLYFFVYNVNVSFHGYLLNTRDHRTRRFIFLVDYDLLSSILQVSVSPSIGEGILHMCMSIEDYVSPPFSCFIFTQNIFISDVLEIMKRMLQDFQKVEGIYNRLEMDVSWTVFVWSLMLGKKRQMSLTSLCDGWKIAISLLKIIINFASDPYLKTRL